LVSKGGPREECSSTELMVSRDETGAPPRGILPHARKSRATPHTEVERICVVPTGFEPESVLETDSPTCGDAMRCASGRGFASLCNSFSGVVARYAAGPMRGQVVDAVIQRSAATAAGGACATQLGVGRWP
jgi:hypothetical protein